MVDVPYCLVDTGCYFFLSKFVNKSDTQKVHMIKLQCGDECNI